MPGLRSAMLERRRGTLVLGGANLASAQSDLKSLSISDDSNDDHDHDDDDDDDDDSLASAVHRAAFIDNPRAAFRQLGGLPLLGALLWREHSACAHAANPAAAAAEGGAFFDAFAGMILVQNESIGSYWLIAVIVAKEFIFNTKGEIGSSISDIVHCFSSDLLCGDHCFHPLPNDFVSTLIIITMYILLVCNQHNRSHRAYRRRIARSREPRPGADVGAAVSAACLSFRSRSHCSHGRSNFAVAASIVISPIVLSVVVVVDFFIIIIIIIRIIVIITLCGRPLARRPQCARGRRRRTARHSAASRVSPALAARAGGTEVRFLSV